MIDWVFFDVGSVLFNDDQQNFLAYRILHERIIEQHPEYTFEEMLAERETHARDGKNWILHEIAKRLLPELDARQMFLQIRDRLIPTYDENHLVNKGVFEVLDDLRDRYRLGIIANQPPECRQSLERRGLLDYFEVVAISDELKLHKPDVRLYEWALAEAGCEPGRSVMVGDRRDNDIAPAGQLSMRTVLLEWSDPNSRSWHPDDPLARMFLESCERVPLFHSVAVEAQPDRTIQSLPETVSAVDSLASGES